MPSETVWDEHKTPGVDAAARHARWRDAVWRLTSLSCAEFDVTYGALIEQWTCSTAGSSIHAANTAQGRGIERTQSIQQLCIAALKVRQSRILPKSAAPEDAARMAQAMSFALVLCILLDAMRPNNAKTTQLERGVGIWFAHAILSDRARLWLTSEPAVVNEVARYFVGDENSQFMAIIRTAQAKLNPPLQTAQATQTASAPAVRTAPPPNPPPVKPQPIPAADAGTNRNATKPAEGAQGGAGVRFIRWLRKEISEQRITHNERNAPVHVLSDGTVFLCTPAVFTDYATANELEIKRVENQFCRAGKHRVRSDGTSRFSAKGPKGEHVTGYVIKDPRLLFANDKPAVSAVITTVN